MNPLDGIIWHGRPTATDATLLIWLLALSAEDGRLGNNFCWPFCCDNRKEARSQEEEDLKLEVWKRNAVQQGLKK